MTQPPFLFSSQSRGRPGRDGANVLPGDQAIEEKFDLDAADPGTVIGAKLSAAYGRVTLDAGEAVPSGTAVGTPIFRTNDGMTTITIPAGSVTSTLTGFPVKVDLSTLGDAFWDGINSTGGNLRVRDSAGTDLPFDLVTETFNARQRVGELWFKATLTTATQTFAIGGVAGATAPAATDPLGRNAVWSAFDAFFSMRSTVNRTGNGNNLVLTGQRSTGHTAVAAEPYSPNVDAHQGVARDDFGNFYVLDTDSITKYDADWNEITRRTGIAAILAAAGFADLNHVGDGCVYNNELYAVIEKYTNSPWNNQRVAVFDLATLAYKRQYDLSAQGVEMSGICYNPDDGHFYVSSYNTGGETKLWKYNTSFVYQSQFTHPTSISSKQGVEYYAGYFYMTCDAQQLWRAKSDGTVTELVWQAPSGNPFGPSMEGLVADPLGNLYILWDNAATSTSYIYKYERGTEGAYYANQGYSKFTVPKRTTWTMGATVRPVNTGVGTVLSYGASDSNDNSVRSSLAQHSGTGKWALWNSGQSWLDGTTALAVGTQRRLHSIHNGTTSRSLWVDGVQEGTQASPPQRPQALGNTIFVAAEDGDGAEKYSGAIDYVYLYNGIMPAAWLAAETAAWNGNDFYTVQDPGVYVWDGTAEQPVQV